MAEQLINLLKAYSFKVEIDKVEIGFKSAKGIKLSAQFEPLAVGGMNDGPVLLPIPVKEYGRITFERGKYAAKADWLPQPGKAIESVSITVYTDKEADSVTYGLESPVIESIELGSLDALTSEVLLETLTISFRRLK